MKINKQTLHIKWMGKLEKRTHMDVSMHTAELNRKTRTLHFRQEVKLHGYLSRRKKRFLLAQ